MDCPNLALEINMTVRPASRNAPIRGARPLKAADHARAFQFPRSEPRRVDGLIPFTLSEPIEGSRANQRPPRLFAQKRFVELDGHVAHHTAGSIVCGWMTLCAE